MTIVVLFFLIALIASESNNDLLDKFVDMIIRPPRASYDGSVLKDGEFPVTYDVKTNIKVFQVKNRNNLFLTCVLNYPIGYSLEDASSLPLIIYSHGNDGNMMEGLKELAVNFADTCGISFDFSGCGNGEGKYVTLGGEEQYDLLSVVNYAIDVLKFTKIGLYGRDMGAVSSLLYGTLAGSKQAFVKGIVLDSAYAHLSALVTAFANTAFKDVDGDKKEGLLQEGLRIVKEKTGLIISDFNPIDLAKNTDTPLLILHGIHDVLVRISQSEEIFRKYRCRDKKILRVSGGHHSARLESPKATVHDFFDRVFEIGKFAPGRKKRDEL